MEERRLLFVGMTRAREELVLVSRLATPGNPVACGSSFLPEIFGPEAVNLLNVQPMVVGEDPALAAAA